MTLQITIRVRLTSLDVGYALKAGKLSTKNATLISKL